MTDKLYQSNEFNILSFLLFLYFLYICEAIFSLKTYYNLTQKITKK